ncbi:MAG: hypothetical protein PHH11_02625 [Methylomonas sp.]|nr:hypothetical protein [Methylomonas sp.]
MIHTRTTSALVLLLSCATSANAAVLLHDYQFNGNLEDSLGGPALVADGGTLGTGSYAFDNNHGLTLSDGLMDGGSYSIAMNFNRSTYGTYGTQKYVDFKNFSTNYGLVTSYGTVFFYPSSGLSYGASNGRIELNTDTEMVFTRDGNTKEFSLYVDGKKAGSFIDNQSYAVFSSEHKVMHFFEDDPWGGDYHPGPGTVNSLRIWDGALSATEVANINAVPLPGAFWLLGSALAGMGLLGKRRAA